MLKGLRCFDWSGKRRLRHSLQDSNLALYRFTQQHRAFFRDVPGVTLPGLIDVVQSSLVVQGG